MLLELQWRSLKALHVLHRGRRLLSEMRRTHQSSGTMIQTIIDSTRAIHCDGAGRGRRKMAPRKG